MSLGALQVLPFQLSALPALSTAMQNVALGHDTDRSSIAAGELSTWVGALQPLVATVLAPAGVGTSTGVTVAADVSATSRPAAMPNDTALRESLLARRWVSWLRQRGCRFAT